VIRVEQVRALEERVEKAVAYITALKVENAGLRRDLAAARSEATAAATQIAELETAAETSRREQASIEEGIVHALKKLDAFEDLVLRVEATATPSPLPASEAVEAQREAVPKREERAAAIASEVEAPPPPTCDADELSLEELDAATAPGPSVEAVASAPPAVPPTAPLENELDIF